MEDQVRPFDDLLVLELGQALAGPYAGTLLADLGANVIHIERPDVGDLMRQWSPVKEDLSYYFAVIERNKKSITLDLRKDEGKEIFFKLAEHADVVLENFAPGAVNRLGIGYEDVKKINPKIIYTHVSGFGQDGPYKNRLAFDQVIQAEAGVISYTGTRENPCKVNVPITDILAAIYAAYSTASALRYREKNSKGIEIDVSMFDCAVTMMTNLMNKVLIEGRQDKDLRMGDKYFLAVPYQPFLAKEGKYVNIVVAHEPHWKAFCKAVGLESIMDDPRFATNELRVKNRAELEPIIEEKIKEKTRDEWIKILIDGGVPCSAVNSIQEVLEHPQTEARGIIGEVDYPNVGKIKLFNNPVKFSDFQTKLERPPKLGEHTKEILSQHGYADERIQKLRDKKVI